jgi:predicted GH43/DUF377 family glycosyl hydrolase
MAPEILYDNMIFSPGDVDLNFSPIRKDIKEETYVLGAFNPGLCRLPNGNLLIMVRIAEALTNPVVDNKAQCIRWDKVEGYTIDAWPMSEITMNDPRKFNINCYGYAVFALTSLSWLLPVELNEDGTGINQIHYDKIISPQFTNQEFGIEDPRISGIQGEYYMTTCCVSSERHSTMLYKSSDGLNYIPVGIILDHQNKDMLLFEGKISNSYYALTRPMGECYFATSPGSKYHPGAAIHLSSSPDLLHWKPSDHAFLRAAKSSLSNVKIGGGTPPILTPDGWLMLYHGVENKTELGIYRTFWSLLDTNDPSIILYVSEMPVLEANENITSSIKDDIYLNDVVFTTGIAEHKDNYIIASGELDLACRISKISKEYFSKSFHQ